MAKINLLTAFKNVATLSAQKAVDIIKGLRGKANGFASLDSNGKVPLSELDIEIGGRNLLKGTFETEQTLSYPTASGGYTDTGLGRVTTLLNGSTYTLSFWAKSTVNGDKIITHLYSPNIVKSAITNQGVQNTNADGGTVFTLTTEWSKYWVTYTVTPNSNSENAVICPRLRNGNGTGTISIKWQKFEEGNKATDWTPAPEDLATASHTHNYAGSSSAGGSATSADKLSTARNISLGTDLTGSAKFDGSGDITISAKHYNATAISGNKSNYPWHRIASTGSAKSPITTNYCDCDCILLIRKSYSGGGYGILKVSHRTNSPATSASVSATWLVRYSLNRDCVKIGLGATSTGTYSDIYINVGTYARTIVTQLEGGRTWSLVKSSEVDNTTTTDKLTSYECYTNIETDASNTIHGQTYDSIVSAVDGGVVQTANRLANASIGSSTQPVYFSSDGVPVAVTMQDTTNAMINSLGVGTSVPTDNDYVITQYVGGGTSNTTYYRRKISVIWDYIKEKISSVLGLTATSYGGNAATATKLGTSTVGSATQPVYLNSGTPTATTYTLGKSVPSNAVFTDTTNLSSMTGTLPLSKGGTGQTTAKGAEYNLIGGITESEVAISDNSHVVFKYTTPSATQGVLLYKKMSLFWNYIKGKADSVYAALTHSHAISDVIDLQTALDGKASSSHIHSSYVNQNAFSTVKVGSTSVSADTATDTLTLTAGNNVTITPDATNDKITISSSHPTISKSTDTTSTASPSAGGTITMVDSVTRDTNGHVTKVNTKTVTLPSTAVVVDSNLNSTSTNPLMNAAIAYEFSKYMPLTGGTVASNLQIGSTYNSSWSNYDIVKTDGSGGLGYLKILGDGITIASDNGGVNIIGGFIAPSINTSNVYGSLTSKPAMSGQSNTTVLYMNFGSSSRFTNGVYTSKIGALNTITTEGWGYAPFVMIGYNSDSTLYMSPNSSGRCTLGTSTYKWGQIYSTTSTISTSDRNLKDNIEDLDNDKWVEFFMKLQPKSYTFIDGTSGRTHVGFVSQDVEETMEKCGLTSLDFAGFCRDHKYELVEEIEEIVVLADEENGIEEHVEEIKEEKKKYLYDDDGNPIYIYSLRYEEFIALNTMMIQKMYAKNNELEEKNNELENRLKIIEEKLGI